MCCRHTVINQRSRHAKPKLTNNIRAQLIYYIFCDLFLSHAITMAKTAGATAKASAKASAKAKAMKSMKAMKSKATTSNIKSKKLTIAQLGAQDSETLDDKIARLRASDACPIAIVEQAGRELSKLDWSKVFGGRP